jgi:hypothetical protein
VTRRVFETKLEMLKGVWCVDVRLTVEGNKVKEYRVCLRHIACYIRRKPILHKSLLISISLSFLPWYQDLTI